MTTPTRKQLLATPLEHVDPTSFDARPLIDAYRKTAFQARNLARAAEIFSEMLAERDCGVILTLAGSLVSAGMKKTLLTMVENDMVDMIVSTGANIVDQDYFEGLGFRHYIAPGSPEAPVVDDQTLRDLEIDRIYDTYIDERELRRCDDVTREVFDGLAPGAYSSRQLIEAMARWLEDTRPEAESVVLSAWRRRVPIFVPAFSDCSAGFGLVMHQKARPDPAERISVDSGRDFLELTELKVVCKETGLLMLGGGVPKNFAQDVVVAADLLGAEAPMHKYAIQLTVADSRDGALSGSTLREACSWGKVDVVREQMVFGELTPLLPLIVSDAYHRGSWKGRRSRRLGQVLDEQARSAQKAASSR